MTAGPLSQPLYGHPLQREERAGALPGRLPRGASDLLETLRLDAEELNDTSNSTFDRFRHEKNEQAVHLGMAIDIVNRQGVAKDDPAAGHERKQAERAGERAAGFEARYAEQSTRWKAVSQLLARIDDWLTENSGRIFVERPVAAPTLKKGERPRDAVERTRTRIAELQREAVQIGRTRLTAAEAKAAARAWVKNAAFGGKPDVSGLLRGDAPPEWPNLATSYLPDVHADGRSVVWTGVKVHDGMALAAWLYGDDMLAAIEAQIDAEANDDRAMTAESKAAKLGEIAAQQLTAEFEEEALIRTAQDQGVAIDRRADADPRAVLHLDMQDAAA